MLSLLYLHRLSWQNGEGKWCFSNSPGMNRHLCGSRRMGTGLPDRVWKVPRPTACRCPPSIKCGELRQAGQKRELARERVAYC